MQCFTCLNYTWQRFCDDCKLKLTPAVKLLPTMPNICLGAYLYGYEGPIQPIIHDIKYRGNLGLVHVLAGFDYLQHIPPIFLDVDAILTVPSHWFRQLLRGRPHLPELFKPCLLPHLHQRGWLVRKRYGRASVGQSRQHRVVASQRPRFEWRGPPGVQSVTILDDVCTTGATMMEIARLLRQHGVSQVNVLSLAYQVLN